jgi:hypothetical protein
MAKEGDVNAPAITVKTWLSWFIPLTLLLGCAAAAKEPGLKSVSRVFLSNTAAASGGMYNSDMLVGGSPTDRFDAQQSRGYVYIFFTDKSPHRAGFTVAASETGREYIKVPNRELISLSREGTWRAHYFVFQIAGRLPPGKYVVNLTIDDEPAGKYPFAVVSESLR